VLRRPAERCGILIYYGSKGTERHPGPRGVLAGTGAGGSGCFVAGNRKELRELYELTEDDKKAINCGLEAVRKGEIATDQEVEAVFAKYRQA